MNCRGIVRHIDELGRVVIPKEIRRQINLSEGDPIELIVTDEGILLKPRFESELVSCLNFMRTLQKNIDDIRFRSPEQRNRVIGKADELRNALLMAMTSEGKE